MILFCLFEFTIFTTLQIFFLFDICRDEDAIHDEGLFCAHVVDRSSYLLIWKLGFSQKDAS